MNAEFDTTDPFPMTGSPSVSVTIIYEDFASGTRARHFVERLAQCLECTCPLAESIWRTGVLDCPPLAEEAARSAAECEYLIISLRGDHLLSFAARQWLEEQLDGASARGTWVIGLLGLAQGKRRILEGNRSYLRGICAARSVDFFSLAAAPAPERELAGLLTGADTETEQWEPRWMETLLHAQ